MTGNSRLEGCLYCNTIFCIVTEAVRLGGKFVLQYKLYCEVQWQETGLHVSQDRQLCRDTASGARQGRWRAARAGSRRRRHWCGALGHWAVGQGAGRAGRAAGGARQRTSRLACRRKAGALGAAGSWASFGARAPGLVFNLVFRLGIFPESLNEHYSLQNNFFKKKYLFKNK